MGRLVLSVDGGGTNLKAALFDGMEPVPGSFMSVPANSSGTAEDIADAFRAISAGGLAAAHRLGRPIEAVCAGMPGPFDYRSGTLKMTHKFAAAKDMPIAPWLTDALGDIPVLFGHDASVFFRGGVYLEHMGAHKSLCGVTLGTGLGFGCAKDGVLLLNENGGPGISLWGRPYKASIAEDYISARAVVREYEAESGERGLDAYGVSLRARSGDAAAIRAFDLLGRNLGAVTRGVIGEHGFTALLLGGAISKSADLLAPALREELSSMPAPPEIRIVRDIDNAPLYGAAAMCLDYTNTIEKE